MPIVGIPLGSDRQELLELDAAWMGPGQFADFAGQPLGD